MEFYVKRKSSSEKTIKHSDDELQHFGIFGMHWGVRRFQNKDGSYTKEGKKRYGISDDSNKKDSSLIEIPSNPKDITEDMAVQLANEVLTEKEMMGAKTKRAKEAAKTGLNCMDSIRSDWDEDEFNADDWYVQEWFLQEDQTLGLPQIADLANRGYSKDDIKKIVMAADEAEKKANNVDGVDATGLWYLGFLTKYDKSFNTVMRENISDYINACVDYNNKEKK